MDNSRGAKIKNPCSLRLAYTRERTIHLNKPLRITKNAPRGAELYRRTRSRQGPKFTDRLRKQRTLAQSPDKFAAISAAYAAKIEPLTAALTCGASLSPWGRDAVQRRVETVSKTAGGYSACFSATLSPTGIYLGWSGVFCARFPVKSLRGKCRFPAVSFVRPTARFPRKCFRSRFFSRPQTFCNRIFRKPYGTIQHCRY